MGLTFFYTTVLSKGATNFPTRTSAPPMNHFPTNFNTIRSFLQFINFSMILATTSIPFLELFDKPRIQMFLALDVEF